MRTSHSLLRNQRHRATVVPAGMRANGNYSDVSVERSHSVSINQLCPSRGPWAACGPVAGFVRPSLGFRCS